MISKKGLLALGVVSVVGLSVLGVSKVNAQSPTDKSTNPFSALVEMISQKFNLDKNQVQTVVNDFHAQKQATRQADMKHREDERFSKLVTDGKITAAQKTAIIAELEALRAKYKPDGFKTMTPEERKTTFQKEQDELTTWAKSQGIDPNLLHPGFGMKGEMRKNGYSAK